MSTKSETYRSHNYPLPEKTLAWNVYGAGLENMGKNSQPEAFDIPEPDDDQILVRIDAISICFSDIKVLKQGRNHPKLYNRDLTVEPTRLGHEVSLTVVKVGKNLANRFHPGQRYAVQPDIYQNGLSTAYGYTLPGGLTQYHLMGKEMWETDNGECLLPVSDGMGYAESSLLEPWGCVIAAYTQRRRLIPLQDGVMWIIGQPGDETHYEFSQYLDHPATILLTNAPASLKTSLDALKGTTIIERDNVAVEDYPNLSQEITGGVGFSDIVMFNPRSATTVGQVAKLIGRRGTLNLVGSEPLDSLVEVDFGRLHYDYIAYLGNNSRDAAISYGEERNRCEVRPGGTTVFVGAGGPMGQMHLQRALELPNGPSKIVATEVSDERLDTLQMLFSPLAKRQHRELHLFNPTASSVTLREFVMGLTDNQGADDVIVSVPVARLMQEADTVLREDGMLVFFAGVPNGTMGQVNLSNVYLHNAQYTGTSGLTIEDQTLVMDRRLEGTLSPARSVAAIGGIYTAAEGLQAVMDGKFPGKVLVFPQLPDLPLVSLSELAERYPDVGEKLGEDLMWTNEAEDALLDHFWHQPA